MSKSLVRPTSKGQVTIPQSIRKELNINSDTFLKVAVEGGKIVFRPVTFATRRGIREYSDAEIRKFLKEDKISVEEKVFLHRVLGISDKK